jgi:hypothetical protein
MISGLLNIVSDLLFTIILILDAIIVYFKFDNLPKSIISREYVLRIIIFPIQCILSGNLLSAIFVPWIQLLLKSLKESTNQINLDPLGAFIGISVVILMILISFKICIFLLLRFFARFQRRYSFEINDDYYYSFSTIPTDNSLKMDDLCFDSQDFSNSESFIKWANENFYIVRIEIDDNTTWKKQFVYRIRFKKFAKYT